MHQQIKGSPDDVASNVHRIVNVLAKKNINIEGIAPDFDPPHVRVVVKHEEPYDATNPDDAFNRAVLAMQQAGLAPEIKSAITVSMPNKPGALKAAMDRLSREGYVVESIVVLSSEEGALAQVSFGVAKTTIVDWDQVASGLEDLIAADIDALP
jgi:hypothetical protein